MVDIIGEAAPGLQFQDSAQVEHVYMKDLRDGLQVDSPVVVLMQILQYDFDVRSASLALVLLQKEEKVDDLGYPYPDGIVIRQGIGLVQPLLYMNHIHIGDCPIGFHIGIYF